MTKEEKRKYDRKRYIENQEKNIKRNKIYRDNNKDKIKQYYKENKDKLREYHRIYRKNKRATDPLFKMKDNIRCLISKSFKSGGYPKSSKTQDILGCSVTQFKEHIESQFEDWMTWDNYGNPDDGIFELGKTWDLDHIKPLVLAESEKDIIQLNHYTNLQPLCSKINRFIKKDKSL